MGDSVFLLDEFVATRPGEPFRLFPFGRVVKDGHVREITPELAALFKLPHFKPPIKLGNHADETPAGGHIVGLEVRDDGLYAIPEYTDQGTGVLERGDYRYHSPEIIWENGYLEHPETGDPIMGPLIVGDALLHTPHLGEAARLYSVEIQERTMESVQVPASLWDKFMAIFDKKMAEPEPKPEAPPIQTYDVEEFDAVGGERDAYKAKVAEMEAAADRKAKAEGYAAKVKEIGGLGEGEDVPEMLLGMTDEQAEWVLAKFSALSAQIDAGALFGEVGGDNDKTVPSDPEERLQAAIKLKVEEAEVNYAAAVRLVAEEQPELFAHRL